MRADIAGMFWDDTPPPKVVKEKEKRTPPDPVWLADDYLPGLDEALSFRPDVMSDEELVAAQRAGEPLIFDVESYPNYYLVSFTSYVTGKCVYFETTDAFDAGTLAKLRWVFTSFCVVGFNSMHYDVPMVEFAIAGMNAAQLKELTNRMITFGERGGDILKGMRVKRLRPDHIDLIEVAPLTANLKIYGGRLHSERMQDLPFPVDTVLSLEQIAIVRMYNLRGDAPATALVYHELKEQLELRKKLSVEYGLDLRSKSDAQIAEAVIATEVSRLNGVKVERPEFVPGLRFYYQPPAFLRYSTPLLNQALAVVCGTQFETDAGGSVGLPDDLKKLRLTIGGSTYQMGLGGLHSSEQRVVYFSNATHTIYDRDVTSYYPSLILNSGMYPAHMGPNFLRVYRRIVDQRVVAKKNKDKVTADSLKITANGTFGKLGSPYSVLYSPHQLIQVTLTGQLSLLMLIERMELAGIPVVSANTDGIVMNCPNELKDTYLAIIAQWEQETNLATEETVYNLYAARDVNNYIAVKPGGKVKAKGAYSNPWADPELAIFRFHKNPANLICTEAVEAYVTRGTLPADTVNACDDVRKFVTVRTVKGGAVKAGEYLGKSIRWYYAQGETGEIVYASSGNMVARSTGARPLMDLPAQVPADVNRGWYVAEAHSMIADLGLAPPGPPHPPA